MRIAARMLRGLAGLWLAIAVLACGGFTALAQESEIDYEAWDQLVARVDRVLEADRADDEALDELRMSVDRYRDRFFTNIGANEAKIARLTSQLDALGPPPDPEADESEPPEVTRQRAELNQQLSQARVPGIRATAAFAEANELIGQIDSALRHLTTDRIFERYPTPLLPQQWTAPLLDLREVGLALPTEIIASLGSRTARAEVLANLPSATLSLIAGAFMVFRTRYWTARLADSIAEVRSRRLRRGLRLVIALAELGLPLIGLGLLLGAIQLTGIPGQVGQALLIALYTFGGGVIVGTWLVQEFFPVLRDSESPLAIAPQYVRRARGLGIAIIVLLALEAGLRVLGQQLSYRGLSGVYLAFVLSLFIAYMLFRLARLFRKTIADVDADPTTERGFAVNVISALAWVASLICILAPIAGLAGYVALTNHMLVATAQSFLLMGLIALVQRALAQFWQALRFKDTEVEASEEGGLVPTLLGLLLILASLPVFALFWGVRVTDLTEVWTRFREGFELGDVTIRPTDVLTFIVVFGIGYAITQLVQGAMRVSVLPKTRLDQGAQTALVSGLGYVGVFLAALIAVTMTGIDLSNLAIFASALAVGIGFGLQTVVSNFVSGIILLVERPVSEGDWIEVGGQMGFVRRISVRSTRIETFDRTDVIVPNADLISGVVTNWTRGNSVGRVIVPVGVSYGTDTRRVSAILSEIANAHPLVMLNPAPNVLFMGFGDSALNFEIRAILRDVNWVLDVRSEMNHEIARRFAEEGIEIPFPQRDVWLRGGASGPEAPSVSEAVAFAAGAPRRDAPEDPASAGRGDGEADR